MKVDAHWFNQQVLAWYAQHGRKDLPWQQKVTPYRVWLSEIMLQQTQVQSVISYFQRFTTQFPTLASLASAPLDAVLNLWSGLGYYARARNLHRTANIIMQQYQGQFPADLHALQNLPGIGRSTAGAILGLAFKQFAVILDGNVKRVLARFHAINSWTGETTTQHQLWQLAEHYTPTQRVDEYTQAMMDLGAMVCTRSQPKCTVCPLSAHCIAFKENAVNTYPIPKPRKQLPTKSTLMLLLKNDKQEILLEKRPPTGIWGGLWSLPECPTESDITAWCLNQYQCHAVITQQLPAFKHAFSHYHLDIQPILLQIQTWANQIMETSERAWYTKNKDKTFGLPAPVRKILRMYE
jgi:A/G-specific adenine glycosylase